MKSVFLKASIRGKISLGIIDHVYTISFQVFPGFFQDSFRRDQFWIVTKNQQVKSVFRARRVFNVSNDAV